MIEETLIERSLPAVIAIAYARLGRVRAAREAAQHALAQALKDLPLLRDPSEESFLRRACQLARDKARRIQWFDISPMKLRHREMLYLKAAGLANARICSILRMDEAAFHSELFRAREILWIRSEPVRYCSH